MYSVRLFLIIGNISNNSNKKHPKSIDLTDPLNILKHNIPSSALLLM